MFERINTIAMFVLMAIGVLLAVLTMTSGLTPEQSDCTDCGPVGAFITLSYILLIVAIVAVIAGAGISAVQNPSGMKGSLIGIGILVAILGLSYALADSTVEPIYGNITETTSRLSGMGLYAFYVLFLLAVLSIAYSSVSRLFK